MKQAIPLLCSLILLIGCSTTRKTQHSAHTESTAQTEQVADIITQTTTTTQEKGTVRTVTETIVEEYDTSLPIDSLSDSSKPPLKKRTKTITRQQTDTGKDTKAEARQQTDITQSASTLCADKETTQTTKETKADGWNAFKAGITFAIIFSLLLFALIKYSKFKL